MVETTVYGVVVHCKHCGLAMTDRKVLMKGDDVWCSSDCLFKDLGIVRQFPQFATMELTEEEQESYDEDDEEVPY